MHDQNKQTIELFCFDREKIFPLFFKKIRITMLGTARGRTSGIGIAKFRKQNSLFSSKYNSRGIKLLILIFCVPMENV